MKIAIHEKPGSFTDRWIRYCIEQNFSYKLVNCYDTDIINQLKGCDGLIWNWDLSEHEALLSARQLTFSFEAMGLKVFPNIKTCWHYDDKVGQKYFLEAIGAPLVKSYVFYTKREVLEWLKTSTFPKVFKLRNGAGSANVQLVRNKKKAKQLINRAFRKGFPHNNSVVNLKERIRVLKRDKSVKAIKKAFIGLARLFISKPVEKYFHREKGYIYFQDFIPNNNYDTRLLIIGARCIGGIRYCRKGDFRASGSGEGTFDPKHFNKKMINLAFNIARRLNVQCVGFDFIWDKDIPKIVEISYSYPAHTFDTCPGYWDDELKWHEENADPQIYMIEDFIKSLKNN